MLQKEVEACAYCLTPFASQVLSPDGTQLRPATPPPTDIPRAYRRGFRAKLAIVGEPVFQAWTLFDAYFRVVARRVLPERFGALVLKIKGDLYPAVGPIWISTHGPTGTIGDAAARETLGIPASVALPFDLRIVMQTLEPGARVKVHGALSTQANPSGYRGVDYQRCIEGQPGRPLIISER